MLSSISPFQDYPNNPRTFKFFLFSLFCGGSLLIFVQHSLIHSHNYFCVFWGSVSVAQCGHFCFWETTAE